MRIHPKIHPAILLLEETVLLRARIDKVAMPSTRSTTAAMGTIDCISTMLMCPGVSQIAITVYSPVVEYFDQIELLI